MPTQSEDEVKASAEASEESESDETEEKPAGPSTETSTEDDSVATLTSGMSATTVDDPSLADTETRFEALIKDRDALRVEVAALRKSLEELQTKHQTDLEAVHEQLQDTQSEKEQAEEQYQNLLGKVNTIRSQLGERLKADAVSCINQDVALIF